MGPSDVGSFQLLYDGPRSAEIYICFVASPSSPFIENPALSLVREHSDSVDFLRATNWIANCMSTHDRRCNGKSLTGSPIGSSYPGLETLRLIDVHQECIVETDTTCRYVTLSYVWGYAVNLRLTTVNFKDLVDKPKALQKWRHLVPRTIQDAILFVRAIGERYLWVDALCLVQNDADDVSRGIKVMNLVYENALFTIVAAYGHDANAGLPGVSTGTRLAVKDSTEVAPGVELGYYITLDQRLKRLPYSTRAWTYEPPISPCIFIRPRYLRL